MIERALIKLSTWSSLDVATLRGWLHALPEKAMRKKPWLQLFSSRVHYVAGQWESAKRVLDELEESLRTDPSAPDAERMLGLVAADRAGYATVRGELRRAARFARQALAHLPEDNPIAQMRMTATLGMAHMRTGEVGAASRAFIQAIDLALAADMHLAAVLFICNLAEAQFVQGKLRQAIETCERALRLGTVDDEHITGVGFAWLELGKLLHQQDDLEAAERHLLKSQELLGRAGIAKSFGSGLALMAQVRQAQGDDKGAQAAIEQAMQMAQQDNIPRLSILVSAYQARIWLVQGQLGSAAGWARDYAQVGETEYLREFEELTLARVLLAEGKPQAALSLLDTLLAPAEAAGRIGSVIEAQALRALALHALNAVSEAMEALRQALELAEPEGHIRIFVDSGAPMAALLRRAASLGITPGHVRKLMAAGGFPKPWSSTPARPHPQPLIEPLSGREMEVLNLLAEGLSNREIAQRLVISLPTVKSHTRSIYAKLDVHSREQAVASAGTLGILPPE